MKPLTLEVHLNLITPHISKKTKFYLKGSNWVVTKPKWRYYSKINTSIPMIPYHHPCYLGQITITYNCRSKEVGRKKLEELLKITHIGRFKSEGCGRIQWLGYKFIEMDKETVKRIKKTNFSKYGKLKIRKGLDQNLPQAMKDLIRYYLLHDFVHTSLHRSKINVEVNLRNKIFLNLLRQSHDKPDNLLVETYIRYDRIASFIVRKKKSPRTNRYNWKWQKSMNKIDFEKLAKEIKEVAENGSLNSLYKYINNSNELDLLNEAFAFGHSSLKKHLILGANLIIRDFYNGKLDKFVNDYSNNYKQYRRLIRIETRIQENESYV